MPSTQDDIIVLASYFNLPRVLQALLQRDESLAKESDLHDALYWASFSGSTDCVASLLQVGVPAQQTVSSKVPLAVAARGGFLDICNLLLGTSDIDPNACDETDQPPLTMAAKRNHADILAVLLAHKSISRDKRDAGGRTAIAEACRYTALDTLSVLLVDRGSDVNAKDSNGHTALHHASIAGDDRALKRLLAEGTVDVRLEDVSGRNAISLAAENGQLAVVKRLHHKGVPVGSRDKTGRNAVSWAANHSKAAVRDGGPESVLEFMARKCPQCLDDPDEEGWSPLAWTLDPSGYIEAARVLVASGNVDVNSCDKTGRSILTWAAGEGLVDIVTSLLASLGIEKTAHSMAGKALLRRQQPTVRLRRPDFFSTIQRWTFPYETTAVGLHRNGPG